MYHLTVFVIDFLAGLQLQSYPHIMCSFCMAYESHVTPDKEDEMCGVCGYRLGMSHGMRQATAKVGQRHTHSSQNDGRRP